MSTTYHSNGRVKWSMGSAYHANGRVAYSMGSAYHDNGQLAYSLGTAYHSNGTIAYTSLGKTFYDKDGKITNNKSFSIGLGNGILMQIIPNVKITVYGKKI
ncbi:hypothetical protein D3C87_1167780 [compost metagenome]